MIKFNLNELLLLLVQTLQAIEQCEEIQEVDYLTDEDNHHPLVAQACSLADDVLISKNGDCRWEAHAILKKHGFSVFPGETDSFGWLSGCIRTCKGIVVYG